jgi:hypothetical protein
MKARNVSSNPPFPPIIPTYEDRPRVVTVPGLIERGHQVIRDENDSDEDYARRCKMFALVIKAAERL